MSNPLFKTGAKKMWEFEEFLIRLVEGYGSQARNAANINEYRQATEYAELVLNIKDTYKEMVILRDAEPTRAAGCVCDLLDKLDGKGAIVKPKSEEKAQEILKEMPPEYCSKA